MRDIKRSSPAQTPEEFGRIIADGISRYGINSIGFDKPADLPDVVIKDEVYYLDGLCSSEKNRVVSGIEKALKGRNIK